MSNIFLTAGCRVYQSALYLACFFLNWRKPKIISGEGCISSLGDSLPEGSRALIVTDGGIRSLGLIDGLLEGLSKNNVIYNVYDKVTPNPTISCVEDGVKLALNMGFEPKKDAVIAVGGGSPIDCAKLIAARLVCRNKSISDMAGLLHVRRRLPDLYAAPTTSGTGSETTLAAVVTDSETRHKYPVNDTVLIPRYAVLDPALTRGLPQSLTASTGMDTLCHAVEAYIGHSNTRQTKKDALETVRLVFSALPEAYSDGNNIQARADMQKAAYLGGRAFTRAYVGAIHAVAHSLGAFYNVPHGLANAIIMPYVLRYYGKSAHKRLAELCDAAEITVPANATDAQKATAFIDAIEAMNDSFGFAKGFPELKEEDIPALVEHACKETNPLYPTPRVIDRNDFRNIYSLLLMK